MNILLDIIIKHLFECFTKNQKLVWHEQFSLPSVILFHIGQSSPFMVLSNLSSRVELSPMSIFLLTLQDLVQPLTYPLWSLITLWVKSFLPKTILFSGLEFETSDYEYEGAYHLTTTFLTVVEGLCSSKVKTTTPKG